MRKYNLQGLWQALAEQPGDEDLWDGLSCCAGCAVDERVTRTTVHPQRGWEYLRQLEMRRRRPRPQYVESDPQVQVAWKKSWPSVQQIREEYPDATVQVCPYT
ncbi:MAG: winged helix-turn-helix domain-containing protein [Oscillatoria sp. SIO1A7]|nr:winged helix-turn-helix domain-containing protein [Oscillatoria sp. SIO1A7]